MKYIHLRILIIIVGINSCLAQCPTGIFADTSSRNSEICAFVGDTVVYLHRRSSGIISYSAYIGKHLLSGDSLFLSENNLSEHIARLETSKISEDSIGFSFDFYDAGYDEMCPHWILIKPADTSVKDSILLYDNHFGAHRFVVPNQEIPKSALGKIVNRSVTITVGSIWENVSLSTKLEFGNFYTVKFLSNISFASRPLDNILLKYNVITDELKATIDNGKTVILNKLDYPSTFKTVKECLETVKKIKRHSK